MFDCGSIAFSCSVCDIKHLPCGRVFEQDDESMPSIDRVACKTSIYSVGIYNFMNLNYFAVLQHNGET